jgi:hypothetical protein
MLDEIALEEPLVAELERQHARPHPARHEIPRVGPEELDAAPSHEVALVE